MYEPYDHELPHRWNAIIRYDRRQRQYRLHVRKRATTTDYFYRVVRDWSKEYGASNLDYSEVQALIGSGVPVARLRRGTGALVYQPRKLYNQIAGTRDLERVAEFLLNYVGRR